MHGLRILLVAIALFGWVSGCKEDRVLAPAAPVGNPRPGSNVSGSPKDAGNTDDEDSGAVAGGDDAGLGTGGATRDECEDVSPAKFLDENSSPEGLLNGVRSPTDFKATRVVATWLKSCVEPTILIELSEGSCLGAAEGQRLQLQLDALSIQNGEVNVGSNPLQPEPDDLGVRFRYIRPTSSSPEGTWGTCAGLAASTIDFVDEPELIKAGRLQASFSLTLPACDGSDNAEQIVQGNFNVLLARGLTDVCPIK